MARLLKTGFRFSNQALKAATWITVVLVAIMFALMPSTIAMAGPVYDLEGQGASQDESGPSIWTPVDGMLSIIRGIGNGIGGRDHKPAAGDGKLVGLQAGHWRYRESPPPFNTQTGGSGGGVNEADLTYDIARRTAGMLEEMGYSVEILPAWFGRGYTADVLVAIHSDGAGSPEARGFFADRYGNSAIPETDDRLVSALNSAYEQATGLPFKNRSTPNSRYYYGFTLVKPKTPMALIETGFLTNKEDREVIVKDQDRVAQGIANGIDEFLAP